MAVSWGKEAILSLMEQRLRGRWLLPYQPPYKVTLDLFFGDLRRNDIANREKLAIDLLVCQGIIEDDSKIDWLVMRRMGVDKIRPRIEITIETLNA